MVRILWTLAAALLALVPASQVLAQETRSAPDGHVPPPAAIADLGWLTGRWVGEGIDGAPAQEVYSAPSGDSVLGHFVQEDSKGGILFYELLQIAERDGSLVYRVKHFGPDLTGWEEKDESESFPLVAIEPGALYFDGLTVRRDGEDGLVAAVSVEHEDGSQGEYVFRYHRAGPPEAPPRCPDAFSTPEINSCLAGILDAAEADRARYLSAALTHKAGSGAVPAMIAKSEAAFDAYRDAECGAVFEDWKEGTIRGAMALSCRIAMTRRHTHVIWQDWLTYPDSTPAVLPEPVAE